MSAPAQPSPRPVSVEHAVTVEDSMMVAHSLPREVFGPAQALHGATYVVRATFRCDRLDADGIVVDIGAAGTELADVLSDLTYTNLDDHPELQDVLTTTEVLAELVAHRLLARAAAGRLRGTGHDLVSLTVELGENPRAAASCTLRLRDAVAGAGAPRARDVRSTPGPRGSPFEVALVVPGDVDRATGGNVWDRRVADALRDAGCAVRWVPVDGTWPTPGGPDLDRLARALADLPAGSGVLLDGLVACGAPDAVLPSVGRLRTAVVVHLPLALETGLDPAVAGRLARAERLVLEAVDVVLATSRWTATVGLAAVRTRRPPLVAEPGTDRPPAPVPTAGSALRRLGDGTHLLCLGSVVPRKGQRGLVAALTAVGRVRAPASDGPPRGGPSRAPGAGLDPGRPLLRLVGEQPDPAHVAALRADVVAAGLGSAVEVVGPRSGAALEEHWRWADLLVVPSVVETYGMVVTEALVRGLPVLATTGGALPDTLGRTREGPPGLLVPPGDPAALAAALDRWLDDRALRDELARRAGARADDLPGWDATAAVVLAALCAPPGAAPQGRLPEGTLR